MNLYLLFFSLFIGASLGSFLNCLVFRLATKESLGGRSHCRSCQHKISWFDNLPVLSWFFLRGRCRYCYHKISFQYPAVEALLALAFSLVLLVNFSGELSFSFLWEVLRQWVVIFVLAFVFIYDLRFLMIDISVLLVGAGFLVLGFIFFPPLWTSFFWALFIGISFFLVQYLVSRGRWIGEGDIWLGGFMALAIPDWSLLLLAIFLSYLSGAIVSLVLFFAGQVKANQKIPLGVFLALGSFFVLLWGEEILSFMLFLGI